jgi:4-hydroxymandelate synthase
MPAQDIAYIEFYTGDHRSALDYFVSSLGFMQVAESVASTGHSALLRQGDVRLVVTEGQPTRAFLEAHGDGIADIAFSCDAFSCDDVGGTRDAALAAGASLVASETTIGSSSRNRSIASDAFEMSSSRENLLIAVKGMGHQV